LIHVYKSLETAFASRKNLANHQLLEIILGLIPEAPFDDEDNYPDEALLAGQIPPAIAGIRAATAHFAVYRLARETLEKIYRAAKEAVPEFRDNAPEFRRLPAEMVNAFRDLLKGDAERAAKISARLTLVPVDVDCVDQHLDMEYLQAERSLRLAAAPLAKSLDSTGGRSRAGSEVPNLNHTAEEALAIIREQPKGKGILGKDIVKALKTRKINCKESTLRKQYIPKLMKFFHVVSCPAAGGYLIP
jgi:hypothetical protein